MRRAASPRRARPRATGPGARARRPAPAGGRPRTRARRRRAMELNPNVVSRLEQIAKLPAPARWGIIRVRRLLVAPGYFLLVYRDTSARLEKLRAQEFELQRRLTEVRSVAANLHEFEQEIARLELKLSKVLRQLPDKKELEILLTDISNAGKKSG